MFYAMAERKIDLRGYEFEHRLEDIQSLNERALGGELDISAISIHAYAYVSERYALLSCGASMGDGYGPMLVALDPTAPTGASPNELRKWLRGRVIAVPGRMTSAYLALQIFLGPFEHIVVPFDRIFEVVRSGRAAVGLIIHEGQLTYASAGFRQLLDLGQWWKADRDLPLPLGGNVLRKDLPAAVQRDLGQIIRESIDYGLAHHDAAVQHSLPYARDMDAALAGKFIGMYVNDYTRDYGERGRAAIREFLRAGHEGGFIPAARQLEFVA
jgi:1,4-dihydroxy-6-naphthoate synthase